MNTLTSQLRGKLEKMVIEARRIAEEGARAALEGLAVQHHEPYSHMKPELRKLRNQLRARARQLGNGKRAKPDQHGVDHEIGHLVHECAYEHWHRMLFARFLAENHLLIEPESGVAVSLEECKELAKETGMDLWSLAARYAQSMLPEIFRPEDPHLQVSFPREYLLKLEGLLDSLPAEVFTSDDALGWVYQFWQAERKEQVNRSGVKIGADELPAVTQLFTEDYMVLFLLHNTIGAWHAGKVLAANPTLARSAAGEGELRKAVALSVVGGYHFDYLRFVRDREGEPWRPAAAIFEGWPKTAADLRILDPCCGFGHFLLAAFDLMVRLRMEEEGLSVREAIDAVLRDNLYGLEIDPRCTQIAAFALALAAWRFPDAGGFRPLPTLNIACSGLGLNAKKEEWLTLAEGSQQPFVGRLIAGMERLYRLFEKAPVLGSLINPRGVEGDLMAADFHELQPLLVEAFKREAGDENANELAVTAQGMAKAAEVLARQFTLVVTNVPYLGRGKQVETLKNYCETHHPEAKADLATCFVERCLNFCAPGGSAALVTPQNWLFLGTYKKLRKRLLEEMEWDVVARLGPRAFETISGEVVSVALLILSRQAPGADCVFAGLDASEGKVTTEKRTRLLGELLCLVEQKHQLENPDARVAFTLPSALPRLYSYASCLAGILNGDSPRFQKFFWEFCSRLKEWVFQQSTVEYQVLFGGRERLIFFDEEHGHLREDEEVRRERLHDSDQRGNSAWGKLGVGVSQMHSMPVTLYSGDKFDSNIAVICPREQKLVLAIWVFCESPEFVKEVRKIDQKLNVTNATLAKVPFDLAYWQKVAAEKYPNGLPKPHSDDPTQWLFNGHPKGSEQPLQVAVARLIGYRWPRQTGSSFPDCPALGPDGLEEFADLDGIVCIPSVRGEEPAPERLHRLFAAAFGIEWTPAKERELIAATGSNAQGLDEWLRNEFFEQHSRIFHHRPFIWHIWDGRKRDGFHALVNYHRLAEGDGNGRKLLETLTYSYLGDWITRQQDGVKRGEAGAEERLAASLELKKRLEAILEGEPPFDIFVRWRPLSRQPIGWEPDINDGVRLNIRPFVAGDIPGGRGGAGILRFKPNIKWEKDRGREPERSKDEFPWFWGWDGKSEDWPGGPFFDANRWNGCHYSNAAKREARRTLKKGGD